MFLILLSISSRKGMIIIAYLVSAQNDIPMPILTSIGRISITDSSANNSPQFF